MLMEDIEMSKRLKRLGRRYRLAARVTTSGRLWQKNGTFRTVLLMWSLRLRYFFGANTGQDWRAAIARRRASNRYWMRISTSPHRISSAATMRLARSGSFSTTTAISAPNSTLVSRKVATMAIGATDIAHIAMP